MAQGRPAKRRRLTPPIDDSKPSETIQPADLFHRAADWELEQDYETRARNKKVKESNRLPIKTVQGQVEQVQQPQYEESDAEADSFLGSGSESELDDAETPPTDEIETTTSIPLKQQLIQTQEEIARLAELINEDPEEHAGSFKKLAQIAGANVHVNIQKLVLVSQAAVYKDTVPGYRIRAYNEEDLGTKISKDVRKTRQYEHSLVTSYHSYVKRLVEICKGKNEKQEALKTTALNCVCSLLLSIPHFNFRTDLLNVIVYELSRKEWTTEFQKSLETLERFFDNDDDGAPSLECVNLLTKMMKLKNYDIREEVLNSFFHLNLLTQLFVKSSTTRVERPDEISKLHGKKTKKEKWEHRSKRERKVAKEKKEVEKDMREADAAVDFEAREKTQSETLKIVFVTYFRILKARIPHLMGAVLEGLSKYAHLINQDFFGDILEALKDIIRQAEQAGDADEADVTAEWNHTRESLLAIQTAFTLLSQQDAAKSASALHLDLSFFTSHVYKTLYAASTDADVELGPKSMHLDDPNSRDGIRRHNKVNISTPVLLLRRALTSILLSPSSPPTAQTVAAFYKRLLSATLQLPEKSLKSILALLTEIVTKHGRKLEPLWYSDERKGDGVFRGDAETVEATQVFSVGSGVWEEELLRRHYCPFASEQVREMDKLIAGLSK